MPRLFVISAPSGAGKTTLCAKLLEEFRDRMVLSISCTTRAPRGGEQHGTQYYFLSRDEFQKQIAQGTFAEHALVHDNYYGTSSQTIRDAFKRGRHVLLDIDVQGAASLRKAFPKDAFTIFVSPPSLEELERRLRARGTEPEATVLKRLSNARQEMMAIDQFDRVIINDDLERSYSELRETVLKEMSR